MLHKPVFTGILLFLIALLTGCSEAPAGPPVVDGIETQLGRSGKKVRKGKGKRGKKGKRFRKGRKGKGKAKSKGRKRKRSVDVDIIRPDDPLCRQACDTFAGCGLQDFDVCKKSCRRLDEATLRRLAKMSCSAIDNLLGGARPDPQGDGSGCGDRGVDDCPGETTCCNDGAARLTMPGEPGVCLPYAECVP